MNFANLEDFKWPIIIAGPCVIENQELLYIVAEKLKKLSEMYNITIVFKSSFDKANRTSVKSFRGPGLDEGLRMMEKVKEKFELPLLTDIHESCQAKAVGQVIDIIQIPAFLCRQTDLLVEAGKTKRIINIKKAQFLSGMDMKYPAEKVKSTGNNQILLTERGNTYGYNNLAVDFRNIIDMKNLGYKTIMDCTHSVQRPGGGDGITVGNRDYVPNMALAAKAFNADGYFIETHPDPDHAKSDAANMLLLNELQNLIERILQ